MDQDLYFKNKNTLLFTILFQVTEKFLSIFHDLIEGKYYSQGLEEIEGSMSSNYSPNMRLIPFAREQFDGLYQDLVKATQGLLTILFHFLK